MTNDIAAISVGQEARIGCYELLDTIVEGTFAKVRVGWQILTR